MIILHPDDHTIICCAPIPDTSDLRVILSWRDGRGLFPNTIGAPIRSLQSWEVEEAAEAEAARLTDPIPWPARCRPDGQRVLTRWEDREGLQILRWGRAAVLYVVRLDGCYSLTGPGSQRNIPLSDNGGPVLGWRAARLAALEYLGTVAVWEMPPSLRDGGME
jgi:hypothetical protein